MTNICSNPVSKIVKHRNTRTSYPHMRVIRGEGRLSGVIQEKGQPAAGMIVNLFLSLDNAFLKSTITDVDGSYSFEGIDASQIYDVIAYDPAGKWEKRVSSRRQPIEHKNMTLSVQGFTSGEGANLALQHFNIVTPPINQNVALGKNVTGNFVPYAGSFSLVTDGNISSNSYLGGGVGVGGYVTIDFGSEKYVIDAINVRHYFADGRTYHGTKTEISEDGINWTTVFDSSISGEYPEVSAGNVITFPQQPVLFIRDYLNGSSADADSHWVEIQAFRTT